jgi:hypothetical protein
LGLNPTPLHVVVSTENLIEPQLDDDPDSKPIRVLLTAQSEPTCGSQQARQDLEEFAMLARDIEKLLTEIE